MINFLKTFPPLTIPLSDFHYTDLGVSLIYLASIIVSLKFSFTSFIYYFLFLIDLMFALYSDLEFKKGAV